MFTWKTQKLTNPVRDLILFLPKDNIFKFSEKQNKTQKINWYEKAKHLQIWGENTWGSTFKTYFTPFQTKGIFNKATCNKVRLVHNVYIESSQVIISKKKK